MQSNSKRLLTYILKQKRLIAYGVLVTLLMSLVELATGGLLKFITNQLDKIQALFIGNGVENISFPLKFNFKIPVINQKINLLNISLKGADGIFAGLVWLCVLFLFLYLLLTLFNYLRRVFMNAATQRILQNFKADIYKKIVHLPHSFFAANKTGDIVSRVTYDVTTLNEIIDLLIEVARASIYVLVFIPVMFYMSWQLSLFTILFFPISIIIIHFVTKKIKGVGKNITDNVGDYTAFLEERINRSKLIKSYGKEQAENSTFTQLIEENYQHNLRLIKLRYSLNPTNDFLSMILLSAVYVYYSYKITHSTTSLGDIVLFLFLVKTAYKPVKKVAEAWGQLHVALVSTRKIFKLLDEPDETSVDTGSLLSITTIKNIAFSDVHFSYKPNDIAVLKGINLSVDTGNIIGIMGKTGAGKTTLMSMLPRFLFPSKGAVLLNNEPLNSYNINQLRANIKYVDTNALYFNGTLRENIAYSGVAVAESEMQIYSNYLGINSGASLDTLIGKSGMGISEGQQQKLAIARAIASKPQVLILDEVFSSLDLEDIKTTFEMCKNIPFVFVVSRKTEVRTYFTRVYTVAGGVVEPT